MPGDLREMTGIVIVEKVRKAASDWQDRHQLNHQKFSMWQRYIFGVHWKHEGKAYYDEFPADSKEEAEEYFNYHKRDDVTLVRVERVRPDDNGVREYAHSPLSPFSPLMARRKLDKDEDAK